MASSLNSKKCSLDEMEWNPETERVDGGEASGGIPDSVTLHLGYITE